MDGWRRMGAVDLGRGIAAGEIDPVALTEVFLAAIESHELRDRIYTVVTHERARREAKAAAARAKAGQRRSILDGVPVSWKDLFDSAGVATEAGSPVLRGRVPERDAEVLARAGAQGLVCLGKTQMTELAFSGLGYNPKTGTPPCVNDSEALPGGSSSGAAASVAFGLAAAAVGSDTGGSVRVPAAWNDLVGLKTTHGLISTGGVVPLCRSFDTVGPLCRSVADAAALFAALGGGPVDLRGASLDGVRLAVQDTIALDGLDDAVRAGFRSALERLQTAGARVEKVEFPRLSEAYDLSGPLFSGEAYAEWGTVIEARGSEMFDEIVTRILGGKGLLAADYLRARRTLEEVSTAWATRFAGYDAVMSATVPILPAKVAEIAAGGSAYQKVNLMVLRNTRTANLMGLPALTLPTGVPSVGVQFNGAAFGEARLLRLGAAAEAALS